MVDLIGQLSNPSSILCVVDSTQDDVPVPPQLSPGPRQVQVRLTPGEVDNLVQARKAGESILKLAETFGVGRTTVMRHLRRRGIPTVDEALQWDDTTLAAAIDAYNNGNSLAQIGQQMGIGRSAVRNRLLNAGVTMRPRPGWTSNERGPRD